MKRSVFVFVAMFLLGIPAISTAVDCGDINDDSVINVQDVAVMAGYLFNGTPPQIPLEIGDVDKCGSINMSDIGYLIAFMAYGGSPPCVGDVPCAQPANGNHIDIECIVDVISSASEYVSVPIYITTDVELSAFSITLEYDGTNIEIDSIDFAGSICPTVTASFVKRLAPGENNLSIGWLGFGQPIPIQSGGLLATLLFSITPDTPSQTVDINIVSISPVVENVFAPKGGGELYPDYFDCGGTDLKIALCGDANFDGTVNMFDITHIISYIYLDGPPPEVTATADVNNDNAANIFDVTHLISYLYLEGPDLDCP